MKKLFTVLAAMLLVVSVAGCQKKIMASINFNDGDNVGGMHGEMNANATLKDLFDVLSKGSDFTYELDGEGYITSINGKANDELGYWNITLNGDLLNDVIANTKLNDGDECNLEYIPNISNEIVAGWQIADVAREELTDEERQDFAKATEVLLGETYEPVCVLATQVVSGTNFAYLAKGNVSQAQAIAQKILSYTRMTSRGIDISQKYKKTIPITESSFFAYYVVNLNTTPVVAPFRESVVTLPM